MPQEHPTADVLLLSAILYMAELHMCFLPQSTTIYGILILCQPLIQTRGLQTVFPRPTPESALATDKRIFLMLLKQS